MLFRVQWAVRKNRFLRRFFAEPFPALHFDPPSTTNLRRPALAYPIQSLTLHS